jgi:parallel beta-helix repeat protein
MFKGISVNGHHEERELPFVTIDDKSHNIELSNCEIGHSDIASDWTEDDWKNDCRDGIFSKGNSISIVNNLISYTYHSLDTRGTNNVITHNIIDRFAGDAIRNTGSENVITFNTMKNAVIADYDEPGGNHDDLYQSWTFEEAIKDVVLSNNIAIAYCDADLKFPSRVVQGLVCFDGFVENWTIENNLVLVDHPHGITLLGARNCKVLNNTVSRNPLRSASFESEPWIMIEKHKDSRSGNSNVIRNNITPVLMIGTGEGIVDHNITSTDYGTIFIAPEKWNFGIKPTSPAANAGREDLAPEIDLFGHSRPAGSKWDVGCVEIEN